MMTYLLSLVVILIIVIVVILYLGNKELNRMKLTVNQLRNDVSALQHSLTHLNTLPNFTPQQMHYFMENEENTQPTEEELEELLDTEVLHEDDYQEWDNEKFLQNDAYEEEVETEVGVEDVEPEVEPEVETEVSEGIEEVVNDIFENDPEVVETNNRKPSTKRHTPNEKPGDFETGFQKVSENDGNTYEIVENKKGRKRWKKVSTDKLDTTVEEMIQTIHNNVEEVANGVEEDEKEDEKVDEVVDEGEVESLEIVDV